MSFSSAENHSSLQFEQMLVLNLSIMDCPKDHTFNQAHAD